MALESQLMTLHFYSLQILAVGAIYALCDVVFFENVSTFHDLTQQHVYTLKFSIVTMSLPLVSLFIYCPAIC